METLNAAERVEAHSYLSRHHEAIYRRTDRMFAGLMLFQWLGGVLAAYWISPLAWIGTQSRTHPHVYAAVILGGVITLLPVFLAVFYPGRRFTRHCIAAGQMLMSALLIHLSGGRIETHFHVFGSLAFLAFYRDWTVLIPATVIVAVDHFVRGIYWPQSVYGVLAASQWRWLEHAAWVLFEDGFLMYSIRQTRDEMQEIAASRVMRERAATEAARAKALQEKAWEMQRTYEALSIREERLSLFRELIEQSNDAVFVVDPGTSCFLDVNQKACGNSGYTRHELLNGMGVVDLEVIIPDKLTWDKYVRRIRQCGSMMIEGIQRRKNGTVFPIEINVKHAPIGLKEYMIAVVRDITERKRMEKTMLQGEKMAVVGRLAAGVAHEINNPLGVILGFAQAMSRGLPPGSEFKVPISSIEREAIRCKNLVQNLLTFARTPQSDREPLDLNKVLEQAAVLVRAQARMGEARIVVDAAAGLPMILGNKGQIEQVIMNLAKNALDAMPAGGTLTLRTRLSEQAPHSWVCLEVEDTGTGIPDNVKERLFEPFFTTKPVGQGTGLGLSLVNEIIQKHSGQILMESRPGQTVFTMRFPARTGREMEERVSELASGREKHGSPEKSAADR